MDTLAIVTVTPENRFSFWSPKELEKMGISRPDIYCEEQSAIHPYDFHAWYVVRIVLNKESGCICVRPDCSSDDGDFAGERAAVEFATKSLFESL